MTKPTSETVAAATLLLDSMMAGDVPAALGALGPDTVIREPASLWYGGEWRGADGFVELLGVMTAKVDLDIKSYEIIDAGDVAVMTAVIAFTGTATGRSIEMPVAEIYRAADGKLTEMDIYYKDTAALLAVAGE